MSTLAIIIGAKPRDNKVCGPVRIPPGKWEMMIEHQTDSILLLNHHLSDTNVEITNGYNVTSTGHVYSVIFQKGGTEKFINITARKVS